MTCVRPHISTPHGINEKKSVTNPFGPAGPGSDGHHGTTLEHMVSETRSMMRRGSDQSAESSPDLYAESPDVPRRASRRTSHRDILTSINHMFDEDEIPELVHPVLGRMWFQLGITLVILVNALSLGLEAEYPGYDREFTICENVFTTVFLLEALVKIFYLRCRYFAEYGHWFDFTLVIIGVLDTWVLPAFSKQAGGDFEFQAMSGLRLLRLARIMRALRIVKMFGPLVAILRGVVEAVRSAAWVSAILLITVYVCAIFCVELVGKNGTLYPGFTPDEQEIDEMELMVNFNPYLAFGSMTKSMLTLFSLSVLAEWPGVVNPIMVKQPWLVLLFVGFVLFVTFGVINTIVALVVDSVIKIGADMESVKVQEQMKEQKEILLEVQQIVIDMDTDNSGVVSDEELGAAFKTEAMQNLLSRLSLPHGCSPEELIRILDDNGDGELHRDEFASSLFRLFESDELQHRCLLRMSVNEIKQSIALLHVEMNHNLHSFRKEMKQGFARLAKAGHGAGMDLSEGAAFEQKLLKIAEESDSQGSGVAAEADAYLFTHGSELSKDSLEDLGMTVSMTQELEVIEDEIASLALEVAGQSVAKLAGIVADLRTERHDGDEKSVALSGAVKDALDCSIKQFLKKFLTKCFVAARSERIVQRSKLPTADEASTKDTASPATMEELQAMPPPNVGVKLQDITLGIARWKSSL